VDIKINPPRRNSRTGEVTLSLYKCIRLLPSLLVSLLLANSLGCSLYEPPRLLPISHPAVFRPASPQQVTTLEEAIAAIMTVCTQDLGFPPVEPLHLHVYDDAHAYSYYMDGLPRLRADKIRQTLATPYENRLHVNVEAARGQSWGMLLRLLAHEYGHNLEFTLGGGKPAGHWMREGFADWLAAKVMDALGWESYASSLSRAQRELARYGPHLPRLEELDRTGHWLWVLERPKGRAGTHGLSFLAVHRLIEKGGTAKMMDYFESKNFLRSFGMTPEELQRELEQSVNALAAAHRPRGNSRQARTPEWKAGYRWQYLLTAPGVRSTVVNQVAREEVFEESPTYVLAIGKNEYPHAKIDLGVLATFSGGKTINKNEPPSLPLAWPLETGKQWRNSYVSVDAERKRTQRIDTEVAVAELEEVRVPAGTFEAFRVETYDTQTGELISEQWYAPRARWLVKSRIYRDEGPLEQELIGFKLD
jgi:hypothetical protein